MKKLTKRKIEWIIRWKMKGKTNEELAISQKVSVRRVQQLYSEYTRTGSLPVLKNPGRPRKPIDPDETNMIIETYNEYLCNALTMEKVIQEIHKMHIPHNRIHMTLKHAGYAKDEPGKQKRRKPWIHYEREHTFSLIHVDWHVSKIIPGKHVIVFIDDASRNIVAGAEVDGESGEYTIPVLREAIKLAEPYGGIREMVSDRGTQFFVNRVEREGKGMTEYQKILEKHGIKGIYCGINHPQTNGKIEKWFDLYQNKRLRFRSFSEFVEWYNSKWHHSSLDYKTPNEAFKRKMEPAVWIGFAFKTFGW
jgi:putative transposase